MIVRAAGEHAVALRRSLTRKDLVAITINNVIGAGIFTMPAALMAGAGSWSLAILAFTTVLVALMAICTAEVASRFDATGGPVLYASAAFGPLAGFAVGWLVYLSRLSAFGAIAVIMLDYAASLWPALAGPAARTLAVTVFIGALAAVNLRGIARAALTSNILTVLKTVPLVLLALAGLAYLGTGLAPAAAPPPLQGLGNAVLIAFFALMGFEQATVVAGEARNPRRDVPIGLLVGIAGVAVLYALLVLVCLETVPALASSPRPLADAAAALFGSPGALIIAATAVLSCAGSLSVSMIASPRVLFALAAQGELPRVLAAVNVARHTPGVAILVSALLFWLLTVSGTFIYLATFSTLARLFMYASTCAALIVLRRRDGAAPVSIPFGPACAVLALLCTVAALVTTTGTAVRDVAIAMALGLGVRAAVRRSRRRARV